jgi:plastocyanin
MGIIPRTAILTAVVAATSCGGGSSGSYGGSSSSSPTAPTAAGPASAVTITIVRQNGAQSFSPNPASVGGQTVVFRNADTVLHRVRLNDDTVDTGDIAPGATSREVQMPAGGTNYHCPIHPNMIGSVRPSDGGTPPPCAGVYCGEG